MGVDTAGMSKEKMLNLREPGLGQGLLLMTNDAYYVLDAFVFAKKWLTMMSLDL
jgi:hypothetical protein